MEIAAEEIPTVTVYYNHALHRSPLVTPLRLWKSLKCTFHCCNIAIQSQQFSTCTENSVGGKLLTSPEAADGLPEVLLQADQKSSSMVSPNYSHYSYSKLLLPMFLPLLLPKL